MTSTSFNGVEFRQIPGDDRYVSIDGQILSMRQGAPKLLKLCPDKDGYLKVARPEVKAHHAVLLAWKGPRPDASEARHLDGIRAGNHVSNLEWGTKQENGADRRIHGSSKGVKNPAARMTESFVLALRAEYPSSSIRKLRKIYSEFSQFAIWAAVTGYTWSHLPGAIRGDRKCFKA